MKLCQYANGADRALKSRLTGPENFKFAGCNDGHIFTAPVGSFAANAFGLHDMHGNVQEWTEDCSHPTYQGAPTDGKAWTIGECDLRVLRGGSWWLPPTMLRSAFRLTGSSIFKSYNDQGFRVARTLSP